MKSWEGSKVGLVADVDCTGAGESLCEKNGVEGYPSIKWGDPSALEEYDGGRELEELIEFAKENLKPVCSPKNLDLCEPEKKKQILEYQALSLTDLNAMIKVQFGFCLCSRLPDCYPHHLPQRMEGRDYRRNHRTHGIL